MSFNPGEQVGPYRIIDQLGQGGMATVYKAYHAALDRYVALKVLHPAFLEDKNFHARFAREAKLVAKLDHPNIVPIYDYAEHEGRPYLVMKYIEGVTLKAHLGNGKPSSDEILNVLEAVGSALAYAHKHGILHRDVKPSNVILSNEGQIYLADFGLARIAQSGETTLTSDMVIGTPQYISPEQALGKKDLDEGTDIYSFGVMMYEMTVGRVPFSADTPFSIIHDHIYTPLPLPSSVNPSISPDVERVLLKALAKDRIDRYADVPAFVDAFSKAWMAQSIDTSTILSSAPDASTLPPGALSKVQTAEGEIKGGKKRRIPRWAWIVSVVFLCFCCGFLFLASRQARKQIPDAQQTANALVITMLPTNYAPTVKAAYETSMPIPSVVQSAKREVESNPDDPQAQFNLAMAYADAGMPVFAMQEMHKSVEMGANNQEFLSKSANELIRAEYWLPASMMYLKLAQLVGMDGLDQMQKDLFHEAVYKSAGEHEYLFPDIISFNDLKQVDEILALIAQERYFYNHGKLDQAREAISALQKIDPNIPEYNLMNADFLTQQKKFEDARRVLRELIDNSETPEWVKVEAREMLKALPQQ